MEKVITTIKGSKIIANDWHEGLVALCTNENVGAVVLNRKFQINNQQHLKYSCSGEIIYKLFNHKMLNRMSDGIGNIKVYGKVNKASLCFSPGPTIPLQKISETEWIFPDFTDDHFLKIGCLPFCNDYLKIELKEPSNIIITWNAYLLPENLRRKISDQSRKPHYTESKTRRFLYSYGTLMNVIDI